MSEMQSTKNRWIYILICLSVFASGLSTGKIADQNMVIILYFELFIIGLCLASLEPNLNALHFFKQHFFNCVLSCVVLGVFLIYFYFSIAQNIYILLLLFAGLTRDLNPYLEQLKNNKLLTMLAVLWGISISISFYGSPLNVADNYLSRVRFEQTIVHLICFFCLVSFSKRSELNLDKLLLGVSISICLVGLYSIYIYFSLGSGEVNSYDWKFGPPFSNNVRNLGYQVMAGLIVLLAYITIVKQQTLVKGDAFIQWLLFAGLTFLWGFLFWLGGRSSIGATFIVLFLTWLILVIKGQRSRAFLKTSLFSSVLGIMIAEWFSVFSWNGLFKNVDRVIRAVEQIQMPGRFNIWETVWNEVNEHLIFGLGANAFNHIPYGEGMLTHPHNVFVQFLGEWGLVGGSLILILLLAAFIRGFQLHILNFNLYKSSRALVGGMVIAGLTIHALTDGTYFFAQPILNLIIAFAIWVSPVYVNPLGRRINGELSGNDANQSANTSGKIKGKDA